MYDDLAKRLRDAAKMSYALAVLLPHSEGNAMAKLHNKAADAIEELSRAQEQWIEQERNALLKSIPKWIPVTERLPEEYVNVLCHLRSLDWQSEYYSIDHLMEDGQWWKAANSWKHEVTHWMPLPSTEGLNET